MLERLEWGYDRGKATMMEKVNNQRKYKTIAPILYLKKVQVPARETCFMSIDEIVQIFSKSQEYEENTKTYEEIWRKYEEIMKKYEE